jgi:hypothetical protein
LPRIQPHLFHLKAAAKALVVTGQEGIKGTMSRDEQFFEGGKNQISTFCLRADSLTFFCVLIFKKTTF